MTEREGFLGRWSRLKRETAREVPVSDGPAPVDVIEEEAEPSVDLEALPSLESLGAASDYTQFLAKGVPEELRCAALRKAWASDPAIADFRGFGEYDWDCNAPGYGALLPTDDIKQLLSRILKDDPDEEEEARRRAVADGEGRPGGTEKPAAELPAPDAAEPEPVPVPVPVAADEATMVPAGEGRAVLIGRPTREDPFPGRERC
jgi:hypothetical protein